MTFGKHVRTQSEGGAVRPYLFLERLGTRWHTLPLGHLETIPVFQRCYRKIREFTVVEGLWTIDYVIENM